MDSVRTFAGHRSWLCFGFLRVPGRSNNIMQLIVGWLVDRLQDMRILICCTTLAAKACLATPGRRLSLLPMGVMPARPGAIAVTAPRPCVTGISAGTRPLCLVAAESTPERQLAIVVVTARDTTSAKLGSCQSHCLMQSRCSPPRELTSGGACESTNIFFQAQAELYSHPAAPTRPSGGASSRHPFGRHQT